MENGIPYERQYEYAYHAIKKEWSIRTLDEAIKKGKDKKLMAGKSKENEQPISSLEKHLAEQFGFPITLAINKNDTGYFRIPFHDKAHMQTVLEKLGLKIPLE